MRIINLLIVASIIVPFLKGCTQAPDRKSLEDNSELIVAQIIKSELGKQALHNYQLDCFRYDDNSLLIFSDKGTKAIYSNDNSDFRDDYQKWEGHQQFYVTNFFDGSLLRHSVAKISFGDIAKREKKSYICSATIALTTQIWNADHQPGFQVFSITPADWPDLSEEKQNNYIISCIKKLPSIAYNYNYISSFISPQPAAHADISSDILIPHWEIRESLTTLTVTVEWDIKSNSWILSDNDDDTSFDAFNKLPSWPPVDLDTAEVEKAINNKQLFLLHNRYWDENGFNFLANVDAGLIWFDGKWMHKKAQEMILSIYDDFKNMTISANSTLPEVVDYILECFNHILIKSLNLSSFADVEEYLSDVNNKITVALFECIKLAVQNKDISTIIKIEGKSSEPPHWHKLNISDIKEECQKAKKQIAVNVWNDFETTFSSANPTQEHIEQLLTIFPEYMAVFKEHEQYLSKTILPMLTNWIQKYITSVIHEEDIPKLESLEDICTRKKLIAILPIDIPAIVEQSKRQILDNSTTRDQEFLKNLIRNRKITSEWAFSAINEIIQYCNGRVTKKIINNENYLEMVKKIIDDCWGWNASAPLCSVKPELRQKVNDDFKKILLNSEKEFTEQADDKYRPESVK